MRPKLAQIKCVPFTLTQKLVMKTWEVLWCIKILKQEDTGLLGLPNTLHLSVNFQYLVFTLLHSSIILTSKDLFQTFVPGLHWHDLDNVLIRCKTFWGIFWYLLFTLQIIKQKFNKMQVKHYSWQRMIWSCLVDCRLCENWNKENLITYLD